MADIGITTTTDADGMNLENIVGYGKKLWHSAKRLALVVHVKTCYDYADATRSKSVTYVYDALIKELSLVNTNHIYIAYLL